MMKMGTELVLQERLHSLSEKAGGEEMERLIRAITVSLHSLSEKAGGKRWKD